MATTDHILAHIAEDIRPHYSKDDITAITEFLKLTSFKMKLAVTTDIEETALDFLERYGKGHTYHFGVANYHEAKQLAADLFSILNGYRPPMNDHNGDQFDAGAKIYLYLHLSDVKIH